MTYRDVDPRQDVEALVDGTWWPAELRAWRKTDDVWEGFVTYTTRDSLGLPENRLAWVAETNLRPAQGQDLQTGASDES